jgi:hypothetical protein
MRAFAPRRIGPSMSSTVVNDEAHVGHRSTSVKTDHTTSIGASIMMDARSPPSFPMPLLLSIASCSIMMYQMVHLPRGDVKGTEAIATGLFGALRSGI